ncbi:MAG TPA: UDP-glucose 4-epimerase GalE [Christensenellaceae bacterium]|nr:UDP-glucose 4-epimerase GalE [Christensenellaceae bacterium]
MSILVTGGAGYIGSHTCVKLIENGYDIVVVDDLSNSHIKAIERVKELAGKDFPFYEFDVCDGNKLDELFTKHDIGCVIHFAGFKAVGESVEKPLEYYSNNLKTTMTLCRVMKRHNVNKFIFSSSATVYKPGSQMPVSEDAELGCTNPYGWSKLICERILTDIAYADDTWSVVLLRYFNPIGAHESGKIGEDPAGIPNNLVPYITQTALGRLEKLSVFGNDYDTHDGTGVRDYIHVQDLAQGHVDAIRYADENKGAIAINLGTGIGYSVLDIVNAFEKVNGVKVPYVIAPRREGDVATVYANANKAKELLGWEAKKNLEDMCRDSWRWQKQNPKGYAGE